MLPFSLYSSWLCTLTLVSFLTTQVQGCAGLALQSTNHETVTTSRGYVTGYAGHDSRRFVVPYAKAPTGARRFQDPVAPSSFKSAFDASGLPPACPQPGLENISEDCLFLTVYTPAGVTRASKLPVLFWIHGGSFYTGSTTSYGLDGAELANAQNIVVVTVQYRLGLLGFMRNDALSLYGNYGLKDIIMALKYVKSDINSFGGDASRVTLVGQSSGAELIKTLLVTPSATSLFARAILQSAPLDFSDQTVTIGNRIGHLAASDLNCTKIACLRGASVDSLLDSQASIIAQGQQGGLAGLPAMGSFIRPVVDGKLVTRDFNTAVKKGETLEGSAKKLLFTTMKEEGALAISGLMPSALPSAAFDPIVEQFYGDRAASIINSDLYSPSLFSGNDSTRDAFVSLSTDYSWTCPNQQSAVNITRAHQKVFLGQFNLGISYYNRTNSFTADRATHQDDIYALFHPTSIGLTRAQRALVKEVQARWAGFVKTGSPNAVGYRTWWPVQSRSNLNVLLLGNGVRGNSAVTDQQRTAECAIGKGVYSSA
ncbi:Carboxylesterase [Leucosporidium creatinivorum]|uniref:Carboxylic ester hydrolase n=1 Tax=Leucosporidium creatinivorum TaxID=106004 RepID=A0A1Y2FY42_9BASI|nr:Carboxylesterase [Leucosporidium creatinivorum]